MKVEILELNVGALILAPGFEAFFPKGIDYYGYATIKDMVTSLEYERMLLRLRSMGKPSEKSIKQRRT